MGILQSLLDGSIMPSWSMSCTSLSLPFNGLGGAASVMSIPLAEWASLYNGSVAACMTRCGRKQAGMINKEHSYLLDLIKAQPLGEGKFFS